MGNANEIMRRIDHAIPSPDTLEESELDEFYSSALTCMLISKHLSNLAQLIAYDGSLRSAFVRFLYSRTWLDKYLHGSNAGATPVPPTSTFASLVSQAHAPDKVSLFRNLDYYILPTGVKMYIEEKTPQSLKAHIMEVFSIADPTTYEEDESYQKPPAQTMNHGNKRNTPSNRSDYFITAWSSESETPTHAATVMRTPRKISPAQTPRKGKNTNNPMDSNFGSLLSRPPNSIYLLIAGVLPLFLQSKEFHLYYLQSKSGPSPLFTLAVPIEKQEREAQTEFSRIQEVLSGVVVREPPLSSVVGEAVVGPYIGSDMGHSDGRKSRFAHYVEVTLNKTAQLTLSCCLCSPSNWFADLTAFLETVPFAITIANADPNHPGFPLVYGNKAFETMTQYRRNEFIGKSCSFLQSRMYSEKHQIEKISQALHDRVPIKIALTNLKKNKTLFVNMLNLLPVINRQHQPVYVIGVSYDLSHGLSLNRTTTSTNHSANQQPQQQVIQDLQTIDNLLVMIHNILCL